MTETITLFCEIGQHSWQRPSQRGKRPKSCPEHKVQPVISNGPRGLTEAHKAAMQAGRAEKKLEKNAAGIARVRDYQAWVRRDVEFRVAERSGAITRQEMRARIGRMPIIPRKEDWNAVGLASDLEAEAIS